MTLPPTLNLTSTAPSNPITSNPTRDPQTSTPTFTPTPKPTLDPTTPKPTTVTINPTLSPTSDPNNRLMIYGHTQSDSTFITLHLYNFHPQNIDQIHFVHFGPENGSVAFEPCDESQFQTFTSENIIFEQISISNASQQLLYTEPAALHGGSVFCGQTTECHIECSTNPLTCFASTFNLSTIAQLATIECSGKSACEQTYVFIHKINGNAAMKCEYESACKLTQIEVLDVNRFTLDCISTSSCLNANINLNTVVSATISCYDVGSCESLRITSDSNDIQLVLYNYNYDVIVNVPTQFIANNLFCDPNDGYILLDSPITQSTLEEASKSLFGGDMPCAGVIYKFTEVVRPDCYIKYAFTDYSTYLSGTESQLHYFLEFMTCYHPYFPTYVRDFSTYDCFGTDAPTADPTRDPTIDPTIDPTAHPTIDPTIDPTTDPTIDPTADPTIDPTIDPTVDPTNAPSQPPTHAPTVAPSRAPSSPPTTSPTNKECGFIAFDVPYNVIQYLVVNYSLFIMDWNCLLRTGGGDNFQFTVDSATLGINDTISIPKATANIKNGCINCVVSEDQYLLTQIKSDAPMHQLSIRSIESVNGDNLFVASDTIKVEVCDVAVSFSLITPHVVNEQNLIINHQIDVANCDSHSLFKYHYVFDVTYTSQENSFNISISNSSLSNEITVPKEAETGDYALYIRQNERSHAANVKIETESLKFTICDVEFSFELSPKTFAPGQYIDVSPHLSSINCNVTEIQRGIPHPYKFSIFSPELQINHMIEYNAKTQNCKICGISGQCFDGCSNVLLPNVDGDNEAHLQNDAFQIMVESETDTNGANIAISGAEMEIHSSVCGVGEGADANAFLTDCNPCLMDEIKFTTGTRPCYKCNSIDLEHTHSCLGSYRMRIPYNEWSTAFNQEARSIHKLYDIAYDDIIFTAACPQGFCCSNVDGCDYLIPVSVSMRNNNSNYTNNYTVNPHLCTQNRDRESALCTQCNDGMSELFGSSACGICRKWNSVALCLMLFLSLLFVSWVLFIDSPPPKASSIAQQEYNWKRVIVTDQLNHLKTLLLKIIMYFYQSLLQIITSQQIFHNLLPLLGPFSLSFASSSDSAVDGFCIIPRLNSLQEIVTNYLFIALLFGILVWFGIMSHLQKKWNIVCCLERCYDPHLVASFIRIFLIISGSLMATSWKLLSCVNLAIYQTKYVHFYQTSAECFDGYWFIALFVLCFTIAIYAFMLWRICTKYDEYTRSDVKCEYRGMLKSFKSNCFWFEFVLFCRRFAIASLTQIVLFLNAPALTTILIGLLAVFSYIHIRKFPFLYFDLNVIEAICLLLLIMVISAHQLHLQSSGNDPLITICIILPILIFVAYVLKLIVLVLRLRNKATPTAYLQAMIDSAQKRIPKRYQVPLHAHSMKPGNIRDELNSNDDDDVIEGGTGGGTVHVTPDIEAETKPVSATPGDAIPNDNEASSISCKLIFDGECVSKKDDTPSHSHDMDQIELQQTLAVQYVPDPIKH